MPEFYPPQLNLPLVRGCQLFSPLIGHIHYNMRLEVQPDCLRQLLALRDHRVLLLPNHPTFQDWISMFLLSDRLGEAFHYLAAYERFHGLGGWFLQQMGAYSIRRGLGDRSSVMQTLELFMQPRCRLVIFPEGGCSFQNDTVMPFRVGAVQVALQAMTRLVKQGEPVPDLYVVPISLKYRYVGDMTPIIHNTLLRLEKTLNLSSEGDFYARLERIADRVLLTMEQDYQLRVGVDESLSRGDRILRIKDHVLQRCEQTLQITPAPKDLLRERVYRIQHTLEAHAEHLPEDGWTYESLNQATARLLNFDAIYDGYVAANPTSERFLDTLIRLERAVFKIDQPIPKGYRRVLMHVGDPVNLKTYFEQYQSDRPTTITTLVEHLRQTVQNNLARLT
ncbi:MAG: 1-acyl-sn-glycerol-3-phosphate acyltransferase [Oculatellaceae cyanobacterium bins.114]|nr:1-acyl-sn-glycerol-3-phosphate acyltransferase [Oculatellaceae cyanobacterium bins.114]